MASDNSNGPRNYYEDQFGDHNHDISKVGAPKPASPSPGSGSCNGSGKVGGGVGIIIAIVVLSLLRAVGSSSRHSPTPVPQFQMPKLDPPAHNRDLDRLLRDREERNKQPHFDGNEEWNRLLKEIQEEQKKAPVPNQDPLVPLRGGPGINPPIEKEEPLDRPALKPDR